MDSAPILDRLRQRFNGLSRFTRWWWITGIVLIAGNAFFSSFAGVGCLQVAFIVLLIVWAGPTVVYSTWWLWRRITYRISVRLFLSYLLIGFLPFPLLLVLSASGDYLWLGQYTSGEFGDLARLLSTELRVFADEAADADDPIARLEAGPKLPEDLARLAPRVSWTHGTEAELRRGGAESALDLPYPQWATDGTTNGLFLVGQEPILATAARRDDRITLVYMPLDEASAELISRGNWYQVRFFVRKVEVSEKGLNVSADLDYGNGEASSDGEAQDEVEVGDEAAAEGAASEREDSDSPTTASATDEAVERRDPAAGWIDAIWSNRWIFFFRLSPEPRLWSDGEILDERKVVTVIKTSPQEAMVDLFRSPYELGRTSWAIFLGLCGIFAMVYLVAVALAGIHIFAITRSTARLTRGARQVEAGQLDYRIPVRRRDQLGDLAVAYNRMTESVENMLEEVAEKERLKNELELAREIQQSLLPARELIHDSIAVHAYFRPAAEVGGDYFDLFPLEGGRLIVAAGDVAGHGLPTGLLMAMVKSMVATLVDEGHRGPDLLERVNRLMLQQPREHRMLTLALAEIDPAARTVEITNAAHPPIFLAGDSVREILLPALPVGYRWRHRPPTETLELVPGARIVFYSDGLVEAVDARDEPFGYEALRELLQAKAELPSAALLQTILAALDEHTGGRALEDDLTLLIIDCGAE